MITKKNFQDEELTLELFLKTRQGLIIRNAFANIVSTDIKLGKAQLFTIIQLEEFFANSIGKIGKEVLMNHSIS